MIVTWLLRLYPRAWRVLYEEEFRAVLDRQPPSLSAMLDVAAGALDARLHLDQRIGRGRTPLATVRTTALTVLCAYVACLVAVCHFGALVDDGPYAFNMAAGHPGPLLDPDLRNPLSVAADALAAGALGAALALLIGGAPLVLTAWTRAPHRRRLFLGPPLAAVAMLLPPVVALVAHLLTGGAVSSTALFTPGAPAGAAYTLWIIAAAGAGTAAMVRALGRDTLDARCVRFAFVPSVVATMALLLMTGATIAWGVIAHLQAPHLFDAVTLRAGYVTVLPWAIIVALMGAASVAAVRAVVRAGPVRGAVA